MLSALLSPDSADEATLNSLWSAIKTFTDEEVSKFNSQVVYSSENDTSADTFINIVKKGLIATRPQVVNVSNVLAGVSLSHDTMSFLNLAASFKNPTDYSGEEISKVFLGLPQDKTSSGFLGALFGGTLFPEELRTSEIIPLALQALYLKRTIPAFEASINILDQTFSPEWKESWGKEVSGYVTTLLTTFKQDKTALDILYKTLLGRIQTLKQVTNYVTIDGNAIDLSDKDAELITVVVGKAASFSLIANYSSNMAIETVSYLTGIRDTYLQGIDTKFVDAANLFASILNYKLTLDTIDSLVASKEDVKALANEVKKTLYKDGDSASANNPYADTFETSLVKQKILEEIIALQAQFDEVLTNYVTASDKKTTYKTIDNPFIRGLLVRYNTYMDKAAFSKSLAVYRDTINALVADGEWSSSKESVDALFNNVPLVVTGINLVTGMSSKETDNIKNQNAVKGFVYKRVKGSLSLVPIKTEREAEGKFVGTKLGTAGRDKSQEQSVQYIRTFQEDVANVSTILSSAKLKFASIATKAKLENAESMGEAFNVILSNLTITNEIFNLFKRVKTGGFTQLLSTSFQEELYSFMASIKGLPQSDLTFHIDLMDSLRKSIKHESHGFEYIFALLDSTTNVDQAFKDLGEALANYSANSTEDKLGSTAAALPDVAKSNYTTDVKAIVKQYKEVTIGLEHDLKRLETIPNNQSASSLFGSIYAKLACVLDDTYIGKVNYLVNLYFTTSGLKTLKTTLKDSSGSRKVNTQERLDIINQQLDTLTTSGKIDTKVYNDLVTEKASLEAAVAKYLDKNVPSVWSDTLNRITNIKNHLTANRDGVYTGLISAFNSDGIYSNAIDSKKSNVPEVIIFMSKLKEALPKASNTVQEAVEYVMSHLKDIREAQEAEEANIKAAVPNKSYTKALEVAATILNALEWTYDSENNQFTTPSGIVTDFTQLLARNSDYIIPGLLAYLGLNKSVTDPGKVGRFFNLSLAYGIKTSIEDKVKYVPIYMYNEIEIMYSQHE